MNIFNKKILLISLFFTITASLLQAAAYRTCNGKIIHWGDHDTTMYINNHSMPEGGSWDMRTKDMINEWNDVAGSDFTFNVGRDTDNTVSTTNEKNEIAFMSYPNESFLGVTYSRYFCYKVLVTHRGYKEADIYMNTKYSWTGGSYSGDNTLSPYNFQLVMLHELGHAAGLMHSDSNLNTMMTYYPHGGPVGHTQETTPHGDDRFGMYLLYPDRYTTGRDVTVSRFKINGQSTESNDIYKTNGVKTTSLLKGLEYDLEYTIENLGLQTESAKVSFYISTNSYISKYDKYIGSSNWSIGRRSSTTALKRFIMPQLEHGKYYYVGYIIDPENSIPESNEQNNFISLRFKYLNLSL